MPSDQPNSARTLLVTSALSVLVTAGLFWFTTIPLGVPGEWTWERFAADPQTGMNFLLAGLGAAAYLGFVALGWHRLQLTRLWTSEVVVWHLGLFVAALSWLWIVQETAPPEGQLAKAPFILFYPGSSGYFTEVRTKSPAAGPFLRDYGKLMRQGDVLHVGTHPPGLFLVFHGLIAAVERNPAWTPRLQASEPESVREAFAVIAENSAVTTHPLNANDRAVIWLAILLAMGCAAATVWPLYGLLRFTLDRPLAWIGASVWPAIPAVAIFLPKSDQVFPLFACLLVYCWAQAIRRGSMLWGISAGLIAWCGLCGSLAFLPVGLFAALAAGCAVLHGAVAWRRCLLPVVGGGMGLLIPIALLAAFCQVNLFEIWGWNYHNHAGFYAQFPRTYWAWLLVNPLEATFAVGAPIVVAVAFASASWQIDRRRWSLAASIAACGAVVWGLLWLTGKNSSEAARLWGLLMPGLVWWAMQAWRAVPVNQQGRALLLWLACQLATGILTVHRVDGFHLGR